MNGKTRYKSAIFMVVMSLFMVMLGAGMAFAYFTARLNTGESSLQFGIMEIDTISDFAVTTSGGETLLMPGSVLTFSGTIKLSTNSNIDAFVRMKPSIAVSGTSVEITDAHIQQIHNTFINAIAGSANSKWRKADTNDGYLYYAGVFSNSASGANKTSAFNLNTIQVELGLREYKNEWKGVTIAVGLTIEAIQANHSGVEVSSSAFSESQMLTFVNSVAGKDHWEERFGTPLNSVYDTTSAYYTSYVKGTLNTSKMTSEQQVASKMSKSAYSYFSQSTTGTYVAFGYYPQTIKDASVRIVGNKTTFAGYECYRAEDGYLYVKQSATPYAFSYKFSNGASITSGVDYYFRLEPLVWQVLTTSSGKALLLSVTEITALPYYISTADRTISGATVYANNYQHSTVRAYLNGISYYGVGGATDSTYNGKGFLQQAFSTAQQSKIATTTIDNSASTTNNITNSYACGNTTDKIFLISFAETKKSEYGFSSETASDSTRIKYPTDYAGAKTTLRDGTKASRGGYYWMRSPKAENKALALGVDFDGGLDYGDVNMDCVGVVPMLYLTL